MKNCMITLPLPTILLILAHTLGAQIDPGVRKAEAGAGSALPGLTESELKFFRSGREAFLEVDSVTGSIPGTSVGLGPRFNMDSCGGCHAQPAAGGTSPFTNPQVAVATKEGASNHVPFFVTVDGPVREARFKRNPDGSRDGGVHNLFTITGRTDAPGCRIHQPNFNRAAEDNNLVFRIPTAVFGGGLLESIADSTILANKVADLERKQALGISGHENRNGNDGTLTRLGWKAQNKSLTIFAGEAYNVEQGVTNELFPSEREEAPGCRFNKTPEDHTNVDQKDPAESAGDTIRFAMFMRFLAPPMPASETPSTRRGAALFSKIGCAVCHTPSMETGVSYSKALSNQRANLFSDLLVHHMGPELADDIIQGLAGPDEFRTAPLWGLGQRIFFLHDGRTSDLLEAIQLHGGVANGNFPDSEANAVIEDFRRLPASSQQDLLDFLRSL